MALEDYLHPFRSLYRKSPAWFKLTVASGYAALPMRIRYGAILGQTRRFLDESQWWSRQKHLEYQWRQMQALLIHAYENVPYYREAMDQSGLQPKDIRSREDWKKLPLLTKETIRARKEDLVARNMLNRKLAANSGGSTGEPLEFYWEHGRTRSLERAFMWRQWKWAGFTFGRRTALIRGQTVREELWHYDPIDKHLFINAYNMSDQGIARIVDKLRRFKPESIQAYPSTLTLLAIWMNNHNAPPIESVRVLLCGSENLYPAQKQLFQDVFQTRVYSWYGHGESCCMGGYCENNDNYHFYTEYGYSELVDPQGHVVPWVEGQKGELVGTSLINNVMPFIRYRTGDIAIVGPPECTCGRHYPLVAKIEGRKQEYIVTADGRAIALTGLVFGQHWHAFTKIKQIQLEQDKPGEIVVRIAKQPDYNQEDENEIREKMLNCVKTGLDLTFYYVDYIPPTARGKHMFVKQSLPLPSSWIGEVDHS